MGRIPEFRRRNIQQFQDTNAIEQKLAMGRQVDRALVAGVQLNRAMEKADADNWIAKNYSTYQADVEELRAQHRQEKKDNPSGSWSDLDEKLSSKEKEFLAQAPNSYAQEQFKIGTHRIRENERGNNTQWEATQVTLNTQVNASKHVDQRSVDAYRSANPAIASSFANEDDPALVNLKKYARPDVYQKTVMALKSNTAVSSFEGMIDNGNIDGAESLLKSKKFDDDLGRGGIQRVQRRIDRERSFLRAESNRLEKLKTKDGYAYLSRIGDTEGFAMLDPQSLVGEDDVQIKNFFNQRLDYIEKARSKHGIKLPVFHPQEKEFLAQSLERLDPRLGTTIMSKLSSGIGEKQYNDMASSIFEKRPAMGVAMAIVNDNPTAANESLHILKGQKLIKNEATNIDEKSKKEIRDAYNEKLIGLIDDPEARDQAFDAVFASTVSKMYETNAQDSDKIVEQTLNNMMGTPVTINGNKTLPHKLKSGEYASEEWMEDMMDDLSTEKMRKVFGDVPRMVGGEPINESEWGTGLLDSGKYKPQAVQMDGKRVYTLVNERGENAVNEKGDMFIMDLSKVES